MKIGCRIAKRANTVFRPTVLPYGLVGLVALAALIPSWAAALETNAR